MQYRVSEYWRGPSGNRVGVYNEKGEHVSGERVDAAAMLIADCIDNGVCDRYCNKYDSYHVTPLEVCSD